MCGIVGFTTFRQRAGDPERLIRHMMAPIAHRGPDGDGVYVDDGIVLGHRRLSIIDPTSGAQPMATCGRYHIVYNGAVYNYPELRGELESRGRHFQTNSDTEVILQQFAADGAPALQRLNGMFAFAIWDNAEQQLFIARDRLGVKPLYYCIRDGELLFASELKALLVHPGVERRLNYSAVSKYFSYGYVPSPHTIIDNIYKLDAGHYLIFDRTGLQKHCYWDIPLQDNPPSDRTADEWADDLLAILRDSVAKRLRSDVPVGVVLSGGLDSSLITALASQESSEPLHSFSISFDQPSYDESVYARRVASEFGTQHHTETLTLSRAADLFPRVVELMDEPLADASLIPTYALSELAARNVKVILGGDGADELFAGYPAFQADKLIGHLSFLPTSLRDWLGPLVRYIPVSHRYTSLEFLIQQFLKGRGLSSEVRFLLWMGCCGNAEKTQLFSADFQRQLLRNDTFEEVAEYVRRSGLKGTFERLQYLSLKLYFQDDILVKLDRASMAHSIEARVPYGDPDVVAYACRIQPIYKLHGLTTKYVLKRAARRLLPHEIIYRRKAGFMMPVAQWLTEKMRDAVEDLCSASALAETGIFRPEAVRALLDEHFKNRRDHRKEIYALLTFMAWTKRHLNSPVSG